MNSSSESEHRQHHGSPTPHLLKAHTSTPGTRENFTVNTSDYVVRVNDSKPWVTSGQYRSGTTGES